MSKLASALDEGEWSASCLSLFTLRERAPRTLWIGGWVGRRDYGRDGGGEERSLPFLCWETKPGCPLRS